MDTNKCWLDIDKEVGSGNIDLNLIFDENKTEANRSAKIQVKSPDGKIVKEFTVVQKGFDIIYKNKEVSKIFYKEGCNSDTEKGEAVTYTVPAGRYKSAESQVAADDEALRDIERNGQDYANQNGKCITTKWYSNVMSGTYQKECDVNKVGTFVDYSIEEGRAISYVSQADADAKAKGIMNREGQEYANKNGSCEDPVYWNERQEYTAPRPDCDPDTEVGTEVTMVAEENTVSSSESVQDANNKALKQLKDGFAEYAKQYGDCVTVKWYSERRCKVGAREDCNPDTEEPVETELCREARLHWSDKSQDDANAQADQWLEDNWADHLERFGACKTVKWYNSVEASGTYPYPDCDMAGYEPTMHEYRVPVGTVSSNVSQEDANLKAQQKCDEEGAALAAAEGSCNQVIWYNEELTAKILKNDCDHSGIGKYYDYVVSAGSYWSEDSQEDADKKALDEILVSGLLDENGFPAEGSVITEGAQAKANAEGECDPNPDYVAGVASIEAERCDCDLESQNVTKVTISQEDLKNIEGSGYPFDKKEDGEYYIPGEEALANADALAALNKYACDIAAVKGSLCVDKPIYYGRYTMNEPTYRDNCAEGGVPGSVVVTSDDLEDVPESGYPFPAYDQTEADEKAEAAVRLYAQLVANNKATCTFTGVYSGTKRKECSEVDENNVSYVGSEVVIDQEMLEGKPFLSTVDQATANSLAEAAWNEQAQAIANERGACSKPELHVSTFYKLYDKNCEGCTKREGVQVYAESVKGSPFTSYISVEEADREAEAYLDSPQDPDDPESVSKGQFYADKYGDPCEPYAVKEADCVWEDSGEPYCNEGKGYIRQITNTPCAEITERVVPHDGITCTWNGEATRTGKKNNCEGGENAGMEVTVYASVDLENFPASGWPFTSFDGQEAANALAEAAMDAENPETGNTYAQDAINARNQCYGCFEVETKYFSRNDCEECEAPNPGEVEVTVQMVRGENWGYCQPDYESQDAAQSAYERDAQSYVNSEKISSCEPLTGDAIEPVYEDAVGEGGGKVLECQSGVAMRKQINVNACYTGDKQEIWVKDESGELLCSVNCSKTESDFKTFQPTCNSGENGVPGSVDVYYKDLSGWPFETSGAEGDFASEAEMIAFADQKAEAAMDSEGLNIAKQNADYKCTYTSVSCWEYTKQCENSYCTSTPKCLTYNDVFQKDMTSTESQVAADALAQAALEALNSEGMKVGQAYVNKYEDCTCNQNADWKDTGTTRCSSCASQKQQQDKNPNSSTYNETRYVSGGGKDCSSSGSWSRQSTGSCDGCNRSYTDKNSCGAARSGSEDCEYETRRTDNGCSGCYKQYTVYGSCGNTWPSSSYTSDCGEVTSEKRDTTCTGCYKVYRYTGTCGLSYTSNGSELAECGSEVQADSPHCEGSESWYASENSCTGATITAKYKRNESGDSSCCTARCVRGTKNTSLSTTCQDVYNMYDANGCNDGTCDGEYDRVNLAGSCGNEQSWKSGDCYGNYSIYYGTTSCSGAKCETRRSLVDGQCGYTENKGTIVFSGTYGLTQLSSTSWRAQTDIKISGWSGGQLLGSFYVSGGNVTSGSSAYHNVNVGGGYSSDISITTDGGSTPYISMSLDSTPSGYNVQYNISQS